MPFNWHGRWRWKRGPLGIARVLSYILRDHWKLLLKTEPDKIEWCNDGGRGEMMWREELRKDPTAGHIWWGKGTMAATSKAAIGCCVWDAKYKKAAGSSKKGASGINYFHLYWLAGFQREKGKEREINETGCLCFSRPPIKGLLTPYSGNGNGKNPVNKWAAYSSLGIPKPGEKSMAWHSGCAIMLMHSIVSSILKYIYMYFRIQQITSTSIAGP